MKDHYGYLITSRDDLEERVVYRASGIQRAIAQLREGDVLRLQRAGKSYPQIVVAVTRGFGDHAEVVDENGKEYKLWGRYEVNYNPPEPWLRTMDGNASAGEVTRLTVLELSD